MNATLSEEIRNCRDGVFKNPYQGTDKKVVFICSMGILRSATGARLYAKYYNTRTAGSYPDALIPLTANLIVWADELVFVNRENYNNTMEKYSSNQYLNELLKDKSVILDIPNKYPHMHPMLVDEFRKQYEDF
jgi:predicted protein tyrosine phosphatase